MRRLLVLPLTPTPRRVRPKGHIVGDLESGPPPRPTAPPRAPRRVPWTLGSGPESTLDPLLRPNWEGEDPKTLRPDGTLRAEGDCVVRTGGVPVLSVVVRTCVYETPRAVWAQCVWVGTGADGGVGVGLFACETSGSRVEEPNVCVAVRLPKDTETCVRPRPPRHVCGGSDARAGIYGTRGCVRPDPRDVSGAAHVSVYRCVSTGVFEHRDMRRVPVCTRGVDRWACGPET